MEAKLDTTSFELDLNECVFCETRLYQAIRLCNSQQVLEAIYEGEDIEVVDGSFKSTYLHQVVIEADQTTEDQYVAIIYQLSNAGISVNAKDYKEQTALQIAIMKNLQEIMIALLRVGGDPLEKDYKQLIRDHAGPFEYEMMYWFERFEPGISYAVVHNDFDTLHHLVQSWCRISICVDSEHLIDLSRKARVRDDILTLLENNDITNEFVHATLAGDELRMLDLLQDPRCDPSVMDMSFQENWSKPVIPRSLRETAAIMGHLHILHLLPKSYYKYDSYIELNSNAALTSRHSNHGYHSSIHGNHDYMHFTDNITDSNIINQSVEIIKKPCAYCDGCQGDSPHLHDQKRPKRPPRARDKQPPAKGSEDMYSHNWEKLKTSSKPSSKTCNIL